MTDLKICLLGLPGSGKTTSAKFLSSSLNLRMVDVDDDILEPAWGCSVADQLSKVGEEEFLRLEDDTLLSATQLEDGVRTVLALSGSNPMGPSKAMERLRSEGWLMVWLDVDVKDVMSRLGEMKVDRIVGGGDMENVLTSRLEYYKRWHRLRLLVGSEWDMGRVGREMLDLVTRYNSNMGSLVTTRTLGPTYSLDTALLSGLAPDGGLFVPGHDLPSLDKNQLSRMVGMSYTQVAEIILEIILPSLDPQKISHMVSTAYSTFHDSQVVPVKNIGEKMHMAELFHGPSGSFKDLALQLTPQLVEESLKSCDNDMRSLIIVATSGDTGSAVLEGFGRLSGSRIAVVVLYPVKGISQVQRRQMVTFKADNVKVIAVEGDFDCCQKLVKEMFKEEELIKRLKDELNTSLTTANSINWGRLVPQVVYHFYIYSRLVDQDQLILGDQLYLAVPSGNFGNMFSGLLAKRMGVPYSQMIVASNMNKILTDFLTTGVYSLIDRELKPSISPAIDILVASNMERWLYLTLGPERVSELYKQLAEDKMFRLSDEELELVKENGTVIADWCDDDDCLSELEKTLTSSSYLADPHTGVGLAVARRLRSSEVPVLVLSTAHFSKFWPDISSLPGLPKNPEEVTSPSPHLGISGCLTKPEVHMDKIDNSKATLVNILINFVGQVFK